MDVVNIFDDDWDDRRDRPGWQWKRLAAGRRLGAQELGASVYELEPGQKSFPYHYHYAVEEMLVVLRGEPTIRDPEDEHQLRPGDCVVFRRGPQGAHQLRNDTDEPVRVLMLSSQADVEIAIYPDSGKIGAASGKFGDPEAFWVLLRRDAEVDYFEGED